MWKRSRKQYVTVLVTSLEVTDIWIFVMYPTKQDKNKYKIEL